MRIKVAYLSFIIVILLNKCKILFPHIIILHKIIQVQSHVSMVIYAKSYARKLFPFIAVTFAIASNCATGELITLT